MLLGPSKWKRFIDVKINYSFVELRLIVFEDSYCPFNEKIAYALNFHIGNYGSQFNATVTPAVTNCTSYDFVAQAFGCQTSGAFSYVWSGAGGVSNSSAIFSHQYPGPGSYPWQVIVSACTNRRH